MKNFKSKLGAFSYAVDGRADAGCAMIWGHGWARTHKDFEQISGLIETEDVCHYLIDFPGFGASDVVDVEWGTAEYADLIAVFLQTLKHEKKIWVGHSFGCRVGIQLEAKHHGLVDGMVLVAAAGLKRQRSLKWKVKTWINTRVFKMMKWLYGKVSPEKLEALKSKVGSADYRKAGKLRPLFVKVVNEDLTAEARQVICPVQLVFGKEDTETPPELGGRLKGLMGDAELVVLDAVGHNSVLTDGRYGVVKEIEKMMEKIGC